MDELSYYPGLIERGSVFHYRKRVPTDIVGTCGLREIWTSPGTGNRPEAIKRARRGAVELDDKPQLWISLERFAFKESHFWLVLFQAISNETGNDVHQRIDR